MLLKSKLVLLDELYEVRLFFSTATRSRFEVPIQCRCQVVAWPPAATAPRRGASDVSGRASLCFSVFSGVTRRHGAVSNSNEGSPIVTLTGLQHRRIASRQSPVNDPSSPGNIEPRPRFVRCAETGVTHRRWRKFCRLPASPLTWGPPHPVGASLHFWLFGFQSGRCKSQRPIFFVWSPFRGSPQVLATLPRHFRKKSLNSCPRLRHCSTICSSAWIGVFLKSCNVDNGHIT